MEYFDFFNEVQKHLDAELPFVIYRKPNEFNVYGVLQQSKILRTSPEFDSAGFIFSPFQEGEVKTVWLYNKESELLQTTFKAENIDLPLKKNKESNKGKDKHVAIVEKAIKSLIYGDLQKVVISRSELVKLKLSNPLQWFKHILNTYSNTFCYCWYHPKVGMWLGASPETLISLSENKFQTMALAGTMSFEGSENVTWEIKEKEEQQLVVDSILKGLQPVVKKIEKGETITQKAGSLLHLKTIISGELNNKKGLKALVKVLHPTSAVCGLPKEKSKQFILRNENYNREYYTGYLGCFNPESNTHLFVNLRCMQVKENKVLIYVGGGITALSNAEAEWEETVSKSLIMKAIF